MDYAYPGFTDAVPPNVDDATGRNIGARQRRPEVISGLDAPFVGTDHVRVLSIGGTDGDLTATICNYTYSVSTKNDDGTYSSVVRSQSREPRGIFAERVSLTAPAEQAPHALPPQQGLAASPSTNFFGGWKIVGNLSSISRQMTGFDKLWPSYDADTNSCVDQAPGKTSPPRRPTRVGRRRADSRRSRTRANY